MRSSVTGRFGSAALRPPDEFLSGRAAEGWGLFDDLSAAHLGRIALFALIKYAPSSHFLAWKNRSWPVEWRYTEAERPRGWLMRHQFSISSKLPTSTGPQLAERSADEDPAFPGPKRPQTSSYMQPGAKLRQTRTDFR